MALRRGVALVSSATLLVCTSAESRIARPERGLTPRPQIKCPASSGTCSGNTCCEGNTATGGKTFPCPNADAAFKGCQGGYEETVKALLAALTREQKYTFLRGTGWVNGTWDTDPEYYIGNAGLKNEYGIPTLNMQDNGQGFRTVAEVMISQVTSWPVTLAVASSWNEADTLAWAKALGQEFKLKGANVILGPGLNVHRVALGGRNAEYVSGESPYFGARMVKHFVKGVQSESVLAVAKHFVGNNQETNRNTADSQIDVRTMWEVYYRPFKAAVDAGVASFMCSYNLVNGVHSCGNPGVLNTDLKSHTAGMGFDGWVMSDWWALHSFAANEGVDQEMPGDATPTSQAWYTRENLDSLTDEKVDDMVSRMLKPMMKYGLFEPRNHVCTPPDCHRDLYETVATNSEHQALCKRLAANAVVLLKNEKVNGSAVLPLATGTKRIVLLGPACDALQNVTAQLGEWDLGSYYNIGGSGRVIADKPESIFDGFKLACESRGCTVDIYKGTDVDAAVEAAGNADVAFVCGGATTTESRDRASLAVDDQAFMVNFAKANQNTKLVALTMTPGAVVMPWINDVDGALNVFLAGKYTGSAFADAVFGDNNPSAKLLVTIPVSEDDTVRPCQEVDCPYAEKLNIGYLALQGKEVTFPFGHGLSYATFDYEKVGLDSCRGRSDDAWCLHARITNRGPVGGHEVAQLYLSFPEAVGEPAKQLRGFHRTEFLSKGESEDFTFVLTDDDLAIYDADLRDWKALNGRFEFFVGASSRDIRIQGTLDVDSNTQGDLVVVV